MWQYDKRREAASGAAALVPRQWSPPPNVTENNNMTIRRIYNKTWYHSRYFVVLTNSNRLSLNKKNIEVCGKVLQAVTHIHTYSTPS